MLIEISPFLSTSGRGVSVNLPRPTAIMHLTEQNSKAKANARQAGASDAAGSGCEAEPAALSFSSDQDILDYVAGCVEEANRRFAAQKVNTVNRYIKGEMAAHISFRCGGSDSQYHLVCRAIPTESVILEVVNCCGAPNVLDFEVDGNARLSHSKRHKGEVLLGVGYFVYGPKGRIPSFVGIESHEEINDGLGQIFADTLRAFPQPFFGIAKRETDVLERGTVGGNGDGVSNLIQNGAEIVSRIGEDARKYVRQLPMEQDLMDMLSGVRILIDTVGPWLFINKRPDLRFEVVDVMMCAG
jgi:hypothetical protein